MDLIAIHNQNFVAISSFFMEAVESNKTESEKLPDLNDKIGLMPVNIHAHWVLVVISIKRKRIHLFDSMGNTTTPGNRWVGIILLWFLKISLFLESKLRINSTWSIKFRSRK